MPTVVDPRSAPLSPAAAVLAAEDRVRLRPHLTPLRRDARDLQLGFDTGDAVVLADPDGAVTALLALLDGRYRRAELTAASEPLGLTAVDVDRVLDALAGADMLVPPAGPPEPRTVRLVGSGPVALRLADRLLDAGVDRLIVVEADAGGFGPLPARHRDRVQVVHHWSLPAPDAARLTVVVADALEVDRAVTATLTQDDCPHLLVRPRAAGAVVGPLVLPGATSCLRCGDLARTRADPAWPRMLAQLCRVEGRWDPLAADWAVAVAATQVLGHLAGRTVASASATIELGPVDWSWQRHVWPADPACGCCWVPGAEW